MPRLTKAEAAQRAIGLCDDAIHELELGRHEDASGFLEAAQAHVAAITTAPVTARKVQLAKKDRRLSSSLMCGLAILALFPDTSTLLGIVDISEASGMPRSTVHRYAITLVKLGQLEQPEGSRKYRRPAILNGDES